ncbi:unnamed protein product [Schistosoma margrebowiei]|uniref:Uncharacterized protein n=1 Tax=Schistosoma margrebowiei TaxID=48269 RepID=A0A183LXE6_9TREM|nr:unnamed protein product [Schistosoma margrebowiei]
MVVGGSQQETLDPGFVLLGTRQQGVPVILRELVLPGGFDLIIIDEHGGSDADVKARIGKARAAYLQLRNIGNSKQLSTNTKVRIFNTNVKTVLLYGAETREQRKPSSRRYRCLLTVVYVKYFGSVGRTLLATTYCGREQTRSRRRKKSGRSAGSG